MTRLLGEPGEEVKHAMAVVVQDSLRNRSPFEPGLEEVLLVERDFESIRLNLELAGVQGVVASDIVKRQGSGGLTYWLGIRGDGEYAARAAATIAAATSDRVTQERALVERAARIEKPALESRP